MLTQLCQWLAKLLPTWSVRSRWASLVLLLFLSYGCNFQPNQPVVDLKINSVQQVGSPGVYSVTGSTNLAAASKINVIAIRYLRSANEDFLATNTNSNYSILARKTVEVQQGKWQANLNLWEVAPNGSYQEAWQVNQADGELAADLQKGVTFMAIFKPRNEPDPNQPQLKGSLVRFTNEGNEYVQASQTIPINLPTLKTAPPVAKVEDMNGGWGNRSQLPPQPSTSATVRASIPNIKQTDAPLSPSEFLR